MTDPQAIADRVEIEALRGEITDAILMHDFDRFASLFTEDGAWRMPHIEEELIGRAAIRAGIERLQGLWEYFVADHARRHDRGSGRDRRRPRVRLRVRANARRQLVFEPRHLPRPLPPHRGRVEVRRAPVRDQVRRHHSADGLVATAPILSSRSLTHSRPSSGAGRSARTSASRRTGPRRTRQRRAGSAPAAVTSPPPPAR